MQEVTLTIQNQKGLHARAAAKFVKTVAAHAAEVRVRKCGNLAGEEAQTVSGGSILGLMMLGADKGSQLHITAEGAEAAQALSAIKTLLDGKFGEE